MNLTPMDTTDVINVDPNAYFPGYIAEACRQLDCGIITGVVRLREPSGLIVEVRKGDDSNELNLGYWLAHRTYTRAQLRSGQCLVSYSAERREAAIDGPTYTPDNTGMRLKAS